MIKCRNELGSRRRRRRRRNRSFNREIKKILDIARLYTYHSDRNDWHFQRNLELELKSKERPLQRTREYALKYTGVEELHFGETRFNRAMKSKGRGGRDTCKRIERICTLNYRTSWSKVWFVSRGIFHPKYRFLRNWITANTASGTIR